MTTLSAGFSEKKVTVISHYRNKYTVRSKQLANLSPNLHVIPQPMCKVSFLPHSHTCTQTQTHKRYAFISFLSQTTSTGMVMLQVKLLPNVLSPKGCFKRDWLHFITIKFLLPAHQHYSHNSTYRYQDVTISKRHY